MCAQHYLDAMSSKPRSHTQQYTATCGSEYNTAVLSCTRAYYHIILVIKYDYISAALLLHSMSSNITKMGQPNCQKLISETNNVSKKRWHTILLVGSNYSTFAANRLRSTLRWAAIKLIAMVPRKALGVG